MTVRDPLRISCIAQNRGLSPKCPEPVFGHFLQRLSPIINQEAETCFR